MCEIVNAKKCIEYKLHVHLTNIYKDNSWESIVRILVSTQSAPGVSSQSNPPTRLFRENHLPAFYNKHFLAFLYIFTNLNLSPKYAFLVCFLNFN